MPIEKKILLYTFEELSEKAKENAIDWFRETVFTEYHDWDFVYSDADEIGKILGIELDRKEIPLMNKKTRSEPAIYFSGFCSQGDGACFEGHYQYAEDAPAKIRGRAPVDKELHRIADELDALQKRNANCLRATMKHRGHYYHQYCMDVELNFMENDEGVKQSDDAEIELTTLMRDFAEWIYERLEAAHDYQSSDAVIIENIKSNDYTFTASGDREDA